MANMTALSNADILYSNATMINNVSLVEDKFNTTVPMSSYLVAIVVSDFQSVTGITSLCAFVVALFLFSLAYVLTLVTGESGSACGLRPTTSLRPPWPWPRPPTSSTFIPPVSAFRIRFPSSIWWPFPILPLVRAGV